MKLAYTIFKLGALVVASAMLTGCATPALWQKQLYHPAEHPHLALASSQDAKDVLVCYDECCENSPKLQRRAYWLFAYSTNAQAYPKPRFTKATACVQLNPLPLMDAADTNAAPAKGYAAFANANSQSFHLWRDGRGVGVFALPVYKAAPPATFWRVGLTPVAVATDAAIVCGVLFALGAPAAAH